MNDYMRFAYMPITFPSPEMVEKLHYANYVNLRKALPQISPEAWAKTLPNVPAMERRYQSELAEES
jgi:hypothetical protein